MGESLDFQRQYEGATLGRLALPVPDRFSQRPGKPLVRSLYKYDQYYEQVHSVYFVARQPVLHLLFTVMTILQHTQESCLPFFWFTHSSVVIRLEGA